MPTAAQIKQYLIQSVLPVLAGAGANWLVVKLHFLAAFHITQASVAGALTQFGVFAIGAAVTFLTGHHILTGRYAAEGPGLRKGG